MGTPTQPAAQLHQDQDAHHADDDVDSLDTGGQAYQRHSVQREIEEAERAHHHQHDVVPRQVVHPHMMLVGRVGQEADDDDAAHEQGEPGSPAYPWKTGSYRCRTRRRPPSGCGSAAGACLPTCGWQIRGHTSASPHPDPQPPRQRSPPLPPGRVSGFFLSLLIVAILSIFSE